MKKRNSLACARSSAPPGNDTLSLEELSNLLADSSERPGGGNEPAPAGEYLCSNSFIAESSKVKKIKRKRNRKAPAARSKSFSLLR